VKVFGGETKGTEDKVTSPSADGRRPLKLNNGGPRIKGAPGQLKMAKPETQDVKRTNFKKEVWISRMIDQAVKGGPTKKKKRK